MFYVSTFMFNHNIMKSPTSRISSRIINFYPSVHPDHSYLLYPEHAAVFNLLRMYILSDGTGVDAESSYGKSGGIVYECRQAVLIRNVQNASHERPETTSNTERTWNAATLFWDILHQEISTARAHSKTGQPFQARMPKFPINIEEIFSCPMCYRHFRFKSWYVPAIQVQTVNELHLDRLV